MDNNFIEMDCGCKFKLDKFGQPVPKKDFKDLNEKCPKTWELLSEGDVEGCFQIESYLGKKYTKKLKPQSLEHLSALVAIVRPGCLGSKLEDGVSVTDHFVERKNNREKSEAIHPALELILKQTYQLCVYQEQQIKIGQEIAGMDGATSDYYLRKCLAGDSLIYTQGGPRYIKDLCDKKVKFKILTKNNEGKLIYKNAYASYSGKQQTLIIKTNKGYNITCTENHKIYTQSGFKKAKDLTKEDFLIIPNEYQFSKNRNSDININKAKICGYFLSEGCYTKKCNPKIDNANPDIIDDIIYCLTEEFGEDSYIKNINITNNVNSIWLKNKAKQWIEKHFEKNTSEYKTINNYIMNMPTESFKAFVGAYFSGDGSVDINNNSINICISSRSKDVIYKLQSLILRYGIHGSISEKKLKYHKYNKKQYILTICNPQDISIFYKNIFKYIISKDKKERIINFINSNNTKFKNGRFLIPNNFVKVVASQYNLNKLCNHEGVDISGSIYKNNLTYEKCALLNSYIQSEIFSELLNNEYKFVKVSSIEKSIYQDTYDFHVEDQNYCFGFVNGILVHNSIGKKRADLIEEGKEIFLDGCKNTGKIDEDTAKRIFSWIEAAGRYSFNKSHSAAYGNITFLTAYNKAHFPLRFFRSSLSHAETLEEISRLAYNARQHDIYVSTPDIRLKNKDFLIRNDRIYFGLGAIKEVGESVLDQVFEVLENVDFKDVGWTELLIKYLVRIKKTGVKRMIATGCFDFYKIPRKRMLYEHENYLNLSKKEQKWIIDNLDLNCSLSDIYKKMLDFEPIDKKNKAISNKNRYNIIKGAKHLLDNPGSPLVDRVEEISNYEKSFLGIAITAHKIDAFNRNRSIYNCSEFEIIRPFDKTSIVGEISDFKRHITKNGDEMCFVSINDEFARLENLVMFPEVWQKNEGYIDKGNIVNFIGHKKDESFIVQNCIPAELKN